MVSVFSPDKKRYNKIAAKQNEREWLVSLVLFFLENSLTIKYFSSFFIFEPDNSSQFLIVKSNLSVPGKYG